MTEPERVKATVNEYIAAVHELMRSKPWSDGLLGLGKLPGRDAVHERYYHTLYKEIASAAASGLSAQEAFEVCSYLLSAERESNESVMVKTMLIAFQGLIVPLIPMLTDDQRQELLRSLDMSYPPRRRLPCQNEIALLLAKRG